MSQQKIDQHKKDKYERKNHPSKQHTTSYGAYVGVGLFFVLFIVWIGYSVLVQFNVISPSADKEKSTIASSITADELKQKLEQYGDPFGLYTPEEKESPAVEDEHDHEHDHEHEDASDAESSEDTSSDSEDASTTEAETDAE
ncbi:MAG: hypothetical protein IKN54_03020 [Lachnospiraceae bacterium]|nr:hypothetical protein [Lachnospiraceae bacterium]